MRKRGKPIRRVGCGPTSDTAGTKLLPWHREILPLLAQGYGVRAIASKTGRKATAIRYAVKSPAVMQAVQRMQEVMVDRLGDQIAQQILRDAPKNLAFLEQVRDNQLDDDKAEVRDRITAAIRLLDSQLPRKTSSTQHLSGQVGVGVQVFSREEAIDVTALAEQAGIVLPALPAPPETPDV